MNCLRDVETETLFSTRVCLREVSSRTIFFSVVLLSSDYEGWRECCNFSPLNSFHMFNFVWKRRFHVCVEVWKRMWQSRQQARTHFPPNWERRGRRSETRNWQLNWLKIEYLMSKTISFDSLSEDSFDSIIRMFCVRKACVVLGSNGANFETFFFVCCIKLLWRERDDCVWCFNLIISYQRASPREDSVVRRLNTNSSWSHTIDEEERPGPSSEPFCFRTN